MSRIFKDLLSGNPFYKIIYMGHPCSGAPVFHECVVIKPFHNCKMLYRVVSETGTVSPSSEHISLKMNNFESQQDKIETAFASILTDRQIAVDKFSQEVSRFNEELVRMISDCNARIECYRENIRKAEEALSIILGSK